MQYSVVPCASTSGNAVDGVVTPMAHGGERGGGVEEEMLYAQGQNSSLYTAMGGSLGRT